MKNRHLHSKKALRAAMFILLLSVAGMTKANPVDMHTAREVAVKFVNANTKVQLRNTDELQLVTTYNINRGDAAFHIFNTPNGFVIVSADDCATPILGYSEEGQFDTENIPIQLQDYLQGFVEQIQYVIENNIEADEKTARQWELVQSIGHLTGQRATSVVDPLLTDTWGQGCYYNNLCPENDNGPCGHCVTGCVATSMAQIMHYWGYPNNGMGSHTYITSSYPEQSVDFWATTYDWANMPNSLSSSSTPAQINAVATLMWHCGVAVEMGYGASGSASSSENVAFALLNYFGYSDELTMVYRENYDSSAEWSDILIDCLDLGRPIHYAGGNHAFVCDGYDADSLLHFNWGWNGIYNGYYAVEALNIGGIDYNENSRAIINIHSGCTSGSSYQITATVDPLSYGTVSGEGIYNCGDGCTLTAIADEGYSFMYWTENGEQVSSEAFYSFVVVNDRNLVAHFTTPLNITTSANPSEGGTAEGGSVCYYNQPITLTATPNEGYVFNNWTKNGIVVSCLSTYNVSVTEAAEYVANFQQVDGIAIGEAACTSNYLPTSFDKFSMTQQLYTAEELNTDACEISSVSFFDISGYSPTRDITIYMVNTDKSAFESNTDWIPVTEADQVFSGTVTMAYKNWTTIYFDTPFAYDGSSNVAMIVDNNSNAQSSPLFCRTFETVENQAICVWISGINYDPYNPSGYEGTLVSRKNHIIFGIASYDYTATVIINPEEGGTVSGGEGTYYLGQPCALTAIPNDGYFFGYWSENGQIVSNEETYSFAMMGNKTLVANFFMNDIIVFADTSVKALCVSNWDANGDGELSYLEADLVTSLATVFNGNTDITSFDELQYFIGLSSIGDYAFSGCNGLVTIVLPITITSIGNSAFSGCSGLTGDLVIPNSVTSIGNYAFSGCSGLTGDLVIPNSVTSIGNYAFRGCSGLTGNLVIPNSVTSIGDGTFYNCSGFSGDLSIPNSVTSIGGLAFYNCNGFTGELTIPSSVTIIGNGAFRGCSGLTGDLVIPNSVTSIGNWAFYNCSGFSGDLVIPNSITSIGESAFYNCNGFTGDLVIPNSVTSIGNWAFYNCSGFTGNLTIGDSVTSIGSSAFCDCSGFIGNLTIGGSVTSINSYAFYGCSGFTCDLVIPNSVTTIGNFAFYGCSGFTGDLVISNSVTTISYCAFYGCNSLSFLTIGNSVTSIDSYAFQNCGGLTSMTVLAENPPTLSYRAFYNVNKSIPVYVPCGSLEAYQNANGWNEFTDIQELCTQSQTIALTAGWNWFSTNVDITLNDLKSALVEALPGTTINIKSQTQNVKYQNGRWTGQLTALDMTQMYMISVENDCEISLEGMPIDPSGLTVTINNGANWIAFPYSESMSVTDFFGSFPVNNDQVKSQSQNARYQGNRWAGQLNTLVPGKGYMYISNTSGTRTFTFPTSAK